MKDKLIECKRCKGNACYEQTLPVEGTNNELGKTWLCMGCGFTSSTVAHKSNSNFKEILKTLPELYIDLLFEDVDGYIWLPSTLTFPGMGMVFLDGTSKKDYKWTAAKVAPKEEDVGLAEQVMKVDMKNAKQFAPRDFMDALDYIGFFGITQENTKI